MKRIQFVLIAIAFLTVVLIMVALMRNATNSPPPKPVDLPPRGVDMQLENIHYEQTNQDAFKEWELDATSAQYFKSEERIALSAIQVTFFSNEGKFVSTRTGDTGSMEREECLWKNQKTPFRVAVICLT